MSESYKIHEDGLYFVSFAVVGWLDVFTRRVYQDILIDSLIYCQQNKELKLYCYCVMLKLVLVYNEDALNVRL